MANLIPTDPILINILRDSLEILILVNVNAVILFIVSDFINVVITRSLEFGDGCIQCRRFHEMQIGQVLAQGSHLLEHVMIFCKRHTWKIGFEKLGVSLAVGFGIEDGVDVVKYCFGWGGVSISF